MSENHDRDEPLTIEIDGLAVKADMATWRQVHGEILDRIMADERAWQDEQRRAGQVWQSIIWRYGNPDVDEHFSLEDAQAACAAAEDYGTGSAAAIRLPFGFLVNPRDAMELPADRAKEVEAALVEQAKWVEKAAKAQAAKAKKRPVRAS